MILLLRSLASISSFFRSPVFAIFSHDRADVFLYPVSREDVPDYYRIIKRPMSWTTVRGKLDRHEYTSIEDFKVRHHHSLRTLRFEREKDREFKLCFVQLIY